MLKRIVCAILSLSFLAVLPIVSGCEKDESSYSVEKTKKIENVPIGQPKPKLVGD